MEITPTDRIVLPDQCLRCGYDLRGIENTQACPECGLLAERSRRKSDELYDSRPRWLKMLITGMALIFVAAAVTLGWFICLEVFARWPISMLWFSTFSVTWEIRRVPWFGLIVATAILWIGQLFLSAEEGYEPADRADRNLRLSMRIVPIFAPIAVSLIQLQISLNGPQPASQPNDNLAFSAGFLMLLIVSVMLPTILFRRLRGLARRAHNATLSEHCNIIGVGGSLTILYIGIAWMVLRWMRQSISANWSMAIALIAWTAGTLFLVWSIFLMVAFTIAFVRANRKLTETWKSNDLAATT